MSKTGYDGYSSLQAAAASGEAARVRLLLDYGCYHAAGAEDKVGNRHPEAIALHNSRQAESDAEKAAYEETARVIRCYAEAESSPLPDRYDREAVINGEEQMALLDQPRFWHRFAKTVKAGGKEVSAERSANLFPVYEARLQKLDAQIRHDMDSDTPVFCKALFMEKNAEGVSWLQRATECGAFAEVQQFLAARGEQLNPADLLDGKNKPNALLTSIGEHYRIPALFDFSNWKGQSGYSMLRVYKALLPSEQADVKNIYRLNNELRNVGTPERGR